MRISFDLDDTLICYGAEVPNEPPLPLLLRWLVADEPLRLGTRALMAELRARGWESWIYTTSTGPRRCWRRSRRSSREKQRGFV